MLKPQLCATADAAGNTDATPAKQIWTVDTTAPAVADVAPAQDATGVSVSANVVATFSEDMRQATIDSTTFELVKQGSTSPVAATVSYDGASKTATLNPSSADLEANTTYTATVKGGANGVKDLAGNPLASDKTWSFTTGALPAPSNLSAVRSGSLKAQRIDLSWTDNSAGEAKFVIERSTTSNFATNLVTYEVGANEVSYRDTAVQQKTTYYYRVFAVDSAGTKSSPSNLASVTTK